MMVASDSSARIGHPGASTSVQKNLLVSFLSSCAFVTLKLKQLRSVIMRELATMRITQISTLCVGTDTMERETMAELVVKLALGKV